MVALFCDRYYLYTSNTDMIYFAGMAETFLFLATYFGVTLSSDMITDITTA